jgi:hypothetical protein
MQYVKIGKNVNAETTVNARHVGALIKSAATAPTAPADRARRAGPPGASGWTGVRIFRTAADLADQCRVRAA